MSILQHCCYLGNFFPVVMFANVREPSRAACMMVYDDLPESARNQFLCWCMHVLQPPLASRPARCSRSCEMQSDRPNAVAPAALARASLEAGAANTFIEQSAISLCGLPHHRPEPSLRARPHYTEHPTHRAFRLREAQQLSLVDLPRQRAHTGAHWRKQTSHCLPPGETGHDGQPTLWDSHPLDSEVSPHTSRPCRLSTGDVSRLPGRVHQVRSALAAAARAHI